MNNNQTNGRGFGVIEAVVAVALAGVAIFGFNKYLQNAYFLEGKYEADQDAEIVRQYIAKNHKCATTFSALTPKDCGTGGHYLNTYDKMGKSLTSATSTLRVGSYEVRASCPVNEKSLLFETRRMASLNASKPAVNPITQKPYDWADAFHGIPHSVNTGFGKTLVDFEDVPGMYEGMLLTPDLNENFFKKNYGISFKLQQGGSFVFAKIAQQSDSKPTFEIWWSVLCSGKPNRNRLCNEPDPNKAGKWIMSVTDSLSTKAIEFDILYTTPVDHLQFDLADFDGGETWTFTLYDNQAVPQVIPGGYSVSASGYGKTSGNNRLTTIRLPAKGFASDIARVHVKGTKSIKLFGFGFDNFETGVSTCKD